MSKNALNYKLHSTNYLEAVNHSNNDNNKKIDLRTKDFEEFSNANFSNNRSEMLKDLSKNKGFKRANKFQKL